MSTQEEDDAKWIANAEAKARKFGGRTLTDEELEARQRKESENSLVKKKYPDSNGAEMAVVNKKGEIEIIFSSTADGAPSHGSRFYAPDDKDFEFFWKRHQFDNPQGTYHVIMKKFDKETKEWLELGDDWI